MLTDKLNKVISKLFPNNLPKIIAVAVSGGIDSMALIFLLNKITENKDTKLTALIVDHKIREESSLEASKVSQILQDNDIDCQILESYLEKPPESNVESNLREVRYNLLNKFCSENKIEHLFIGHHEQDLAENFLIRLFRGSGIDGLSANDYITQIQDIKIVRPMLDFNKQELEDYLTINNISWFEDESNKDKKYLRNKIRNFINNLDDKDLINQRIALASKSILESRKLIEESLINKAPNIIEFNQMGYFLLNKDEFNKLKDEESKRYLAWILMEVSGNHYKPRLKYLENLHSFIRQDKEIKKRCFYGCIIDKYNDKQLIIYREKALIKEVKLENNIIWDNRFKIILKDKLDELSISNIEAEEFNKLDLDHKKIGVVKNIIYTLPVLKRNGEIIAIPHLNYSNELKLLDNIDIIFDKKTKL